MGSVPTAGCLPRCVGQLLRHRSGVMASKRRVVRYYSYKGCDNLKRHTVVGSGKQAVISVYHTGEVWEINRLRSIECFLTQGRTPNYCGAHDMHGGNRAYNALDSMFPANISWLKTLRSIACLIVLVAHIVSTDPSIGVYASGCGKIGVWLFMLISGMLMILPYYKAERRVSKNNPLLYYQKKDLRIYPLYFVALLLLVLLGNINRNDIREALLMQSAWGHLW